MHYTQRIKETREDRDLKQTNIAKIINITQQQYQLYESGQRELPLHHLITLCEYYNLSADYLLGMIDTPRALR